VVVSLEISPEAAKLQTNKEKGKSGGGNSGDIFIQETRLQRLVFIQ
jgi:hypothetical protein